MDVTRTSIVLEEGQWAQVKRGDKMFSIRNMQQELQAVNLETIIAIGHTDSIGSDAYNQALSVRRAEAVKAYLVTKGVAANRITASGKGKSQPVADNRTAAGREKNRRVDVEIIGSKK